MASFVWLYLELSISSLHYSSDEWHSRILKTVLVGTKIEKTMEPSKTIMGSCWAWAHLLKYKYNDDVDDKLGKALLLKWIIFAELNRLKFKMVFMFHHICSVTRLGNFYKFLVASFLSNVAQIIADFLGHF